MDKKLRIKTILKKKDGDQKLFNYIFNRTLELCSYHYLDVENAKKLFEEKLLSFDLNSYDSYLDEFSNYLDGKDDDKDNQKICLLFFDAISLIKVTYQYCYDNENNPSTRLEQLIGISRPKHRVEIENILVHLASLERLATSYNAGTVTTYWLNQQLKSRKKQHAKGGKTKAINKKNIEQPIKEEAIKIYKNPNIANRPRWKSRNEFSQYFCMNHNKNTPNERDWIKESTVKRWIKELLQSG